MLAVRFDIGKAKASKPLEGFIPNPKLKLLHPVSEVMRFKHYSLRTETTHREWIKRHILSFTESGREMGALEVGRSLGHLAVQFALQVGSVSRQFASIRVYSRLSSQARDRRTAPLMPSTAVSRRDI
jgi:hypothetical protein